MVLQEIVTVQVTVSSAFEAAVFLTDFVISSAEVVSVFAVLAVEFSRAVFVEISVDFSAEFFVD